MNEIEQIENRIKEIEETLETLEAFIYKRQQKFKEITDRVNFFLITQRFTLVEKPMKGKEPPLPSLFRKAFHIEKKNHRINLYVLKRRKQYLLALIEELRKNLQDKNKTA